MPRSISILKAGGTLPLGYRFLGKVGDQGGQRSINILRLYCTARLASDRKARGSGRIKEQKYMECMWYWTEGREMLDI